MFALVLDGFEFSTIIFGEFLLHALIIKNIQNKIIILYLSLLKTMKTHLIFKYHQPR